MHVYMYGMLLHLCMFVCMYVCMYVGMYVCMHACINALMPACMYVCMYDRNRRVCFFLVFFPDKKLTGVPSDRSSVRPKFTPEVVRDPCPTKVDVTRD